MSDESKEKESGHTDEAEDGCDHQAAGASEDEPEQRAEDLATVEGVNRHDVEDEKADVDDVKRSDEHINVRSGKIHSGGPAELEGHEQNRSQNQIYERPGRDAPESSARTWWRIHVGDAPKRPQNNLVSYASYLPTGERVAELVKRDDQEETEVLKDIPCDRRINPVAAVNLVYGNQEPGPVQEDIDPRKAKQADAPWRVGMGAVYRIGDFGAMRPEHRCSPANSPDVLLNSYNSQP